MAGKITKRVVDATNPAEKIAFVWDGEVRGFGLRVTPAGVKSYVLQYRAGTGRDAPDRRLTIGKHGSPWTPESARKEALRLLSEVAAGRDPAQEKAADRVAPTVNDLCDLYLAEGVSAKKESTLKADRARIAHHIRPLLGGKRVDRITRTDVERLLLDVQNGKTAPGRPDKRPAGGLPRGGPGVAAQCVTLLGTMLSFAIRRDLRADNPAHGIKKPKVRKMERFLSEKEIARLADAIAAVEVDRNATYAAAAIRLLMFTGCRRGEILRLRWAEVDFERQSLFLADSKTGRKAVFLNAPARAILEELPRVEGNPYVIVGSRAGGHLIGIDGLWNEMRKRAELPEVRIHDLRHSFASIGAAGGLSLPIIGAMLGHRDTATTARYAHLSNDPVRAANEAVGARIAAAMKGGSGGAEVVELRKKG